MKVHVSVCFLFACTTLGLFAGADPIKTKFSVNVIGNDDKEVYEKKQALNSLRLVKEIEAFQSGLVTYDDYGNPVELDLTVETDGGESEVEIRNRVADRVKFRLYTRQNPADYQELHVNDKNALASSHFNATKPTNFITHGWVNTGNSLACTLIRDAYLKHDDINVIVVDWSRITLRPYVWASLHVEMVGKHIAEMIDFLEAHANLNTEKTTLVGHSLGAHVMGLAGYNAKGTMNYVVGLDPALPLFRFAEPGSRISTQDANHVQIIHTNGGLLGYLNAIGHSDFYPNGGSRQLGCLLDVACSHARSYRFFAESINSDTGFYGKPCNSYQEFVSGRCKTESIAVMGGPLIGFVSPGKYFLATKSKSLFAKGI